MSIPKSEFDPKIFGSPALDSFIKLAYFWGFVMILMLAIQLSPVFLLPLFALLISLNRYVITRLERNLEKHGDLIEKVTRNILRETGANLHPIQVISLWRRKSVSTVDWAFKIKPSESGEELEIIGTEFPK
jgi:hypothetical protein